MWLGNTRYLSVYGLGVAQAMGMLGHWHRTVDIFGSLDDVSRQVAEMSPDVIWTHMALWPPNGALSSDQILGILAHWKWRGAGVFLHDGDPRDRDVLTDVASAFSIALVNRSVDTPVYGGIPNLRWPYAAMSQKVMAEPVPEWDCDLLFAGILREGALYGERTQLVGELTKVLGDRMKIVSPGTGQINNRMLTADVAASARAVLGFGRPEVPGWVDTRVFQWPGAGGVLVHDDAGEFLEAEKHYFKFDRGLSPWQTAESVIRCVEWAKTEGKVVRERAFRYIQANHTWVQRVEQALAAFYGR